MSAATAKVYTSAGVDLGITPTLSADKKTVYFEYASDFAQDTSYKVKFIDAVYETSKKFNAEQTFTVKDVTSPEAVSVEAVTSKTLKVKFSEPISTAGWTAGYAVRSTLKVDGVAVVANFTADNKENTITYDLGTALTAGAHTVEIGQLSDFAGFKTAAKSFNVTVNADAAAPEVTSVEVLRNNQIRVNFNEPVATGDLGTLTVDGTNTTSLVSSSADKKSHVFNLTNPLTLASVVEAKLTYVGTKDAEGNEVKTAKNFIFKATDDTVKPTATVAVGTGNKLVITFSEAMSASGTVVLKDANGVVKKTITAPAFLNTDNKVVEITAATLGLSTTDAATYTVELTGAKDYSIRTNEIDKVTASVSFGDNQKPNITGTVLTGTDTVTIYFSEAMDSASLTNKDNYLVDVAGTGTFVSLSTISNASVAVAADGKSVALGIPSASTSTDITALGLKDAAGNIINQFNVRQDVTAAGTFTHADITGVKAVALNKLEVTSSVAFSNVDPSSFVVIDSTNSNADALVAVAATLDTAKTKLTLTLNGNLAADGKLANGGTPKLATVAGNTLTKNSKGVALAIAKADAETITEEIKPFLNTVEAGNTIDGNSTVEANLFTVTFSEKIATDAGSNAGDITNLLTDLVIKNGQGNLISTSALSVVDTDESSNYVDGAKSVVIKVADGTVDAGSNTFTVAIPAPRNIEDTNGNVIAEAAAKSVTFNVVVAPAAPTGVAEAVGTNAGTTKLTGVDATMEYQVNAGSWVAITGTSADNISVNNTDTIKVRVAAKDGVSAGAATTLTIDYADIKPAAAPTAPVLAQGTNSGTTQLTNVNDTMEYQVNGGSWTAVPASATSVDNIAVTAGQVINVRVKQTATQPASDAKAITVASGDIKA